MIEAAKKAEKLYKSFIYCLSIAESLATQEKQIKSIFEYYADDEENKEALTDVLNWYFDGPEKSPEELRFYCYNFRGSRRRTKASSLYEDTEDGPESNESNFSRLVDLCDKKDIHGADRNFLFYLLEQAEENVRHTSKLTK